MIPYREHSTPRSEMERMRENFASACAAIQAHPEPLEAWQYVGELQDLIKALNGEAADFRGWVARYLKQYHQWSDQQLADQLGISRQAVGQLIKRGKPVTNPTTAKIPSPVVLAIITSDRGVLVEHRIDKIPPWTFPGGDIDPGESPHDTAVRRVMDETGLVVTKTEYVGERIHPMTSRHMFYVLAEVSGEDAELRDREDLDEVRWMSIDETRTTMPDMFPPVRQRLDRLQAAQRQDS